MRYANQTEKIVLFIQECKEEEGVKLTLDGNQDVAFYLTMQQARTFACDLIQHVHRAEVKRNLQKAKRKVAQSAAEESDAPSII